MSIRHRVHRSPVLNLPLLRLHRHLGLSSTGHHFPCFRSPHPVLPDGLRDAPNPSPSLCLVPPALCPHGPLTQSPPPAGLRQPLLRAPPSSGTRSRTGRPSARRKCTALVHNLCIKGVEMPSFHAPFVSLSWWGLWPIWCFVEGADPPRHLPSTLNDPAHMPPPAMPWPFPRAQCLHPRWTGLPQGDTEHREGGGPEAGPCRALSEWAMVLSAQAGDSHLRGCPDTPKGTCANTDAPRTTPRLCQVASQGTELRVCPQRQGRGGK